MIFTNRFAWLKIQNSFKLSLKERLKLPNTAYHFFLLIYCIQPITYELSNLFLPELIKNHAHPQTAITLFIFKSKHNAMMISALKAHRKKITEEQHSISQHSFISGNSKEMVCFSVQVLTSCRSLWYLKALSHP